MSIPPPPSNGITPPGKPVGGTTIPSIKPSANLNKKASPIPLLVAVAAIVGSLAIWLWFRGQVVPIYVPLVGYLLTPFSVVVLMGLDTILQRKNTAQDPWFVPKPKMTLAIRVLAILSFVAAYPHIYWLSNILAEYLPGGS